MPQFINSPTAFVLVFANLVPLYGVLFLGWEVFPVLFLFWLENVIVGVFNVLRIIFLRVGLPLLWLAKIFIVPFFCFHYGMFCFVHGMFIIFIFGKNYLPGMTIRISNPFDLPAVLFKHEPGLLYAALALFLSHGVSFVYNYLAAGERKRGSLDTLMKQPYARIVILHITILASAFLLMAVKSTVAGVFLLVVIKIGVDLNAHLKEHRKLMITD